MPQSAIEAFGRYLRLTRERRGLSLDSVEALSASFADPVNKGYLSRCENGRQRIALSKIVALSRIYEVPPQAFVERLELDLELEKLGGGPDLDGLSYLELCDRGRKYSERGRKWFAYSCFREALTLSRVDDVSSTMRDRREQVLVAMMNHATMARAVGAVEMAFFEYRFVEKQAHLSPHLEAILLERIASHYKFVGKTAKAIEYSNSAISLAKDVPDFEFLSHILANRALIEMANDSPVTGIDYAKRAIECARSASHKTFCYTILAEAYLQAKRLKAARLTLKAISNTGEADRSLRIAARSHRLCGQLAIEEVDLATAEHHLRESSQVARKSQDLELRFHAETLLLDVVLRRGNVQAARAIGRRLRRLLPRIDEHSSVLSMARDLLARKEVAPTQRRKRSPGNGFR